MSISILNTDANLSAKTVVTAEGADTISGLKTYSRSPNPPFAVQAGSATVPNLNAELCAGLADTETISGTWTFTPGLKERGRSAFAGEWSSYTPTLTNFTIGNGNASGSYSQIGKTIFVTGLIVLGTTSNITGAFTVSLPVANLANTSSLQLGTVIGFDSSAGLNYPARAMFGSSTAFQPFNLGSPMVTWTNLAPFTWATSDQIVWSLTYQDAS